MEVKGIFVTRIGKANAKLCFDEIAKKYGNQTTLIVGSSTQKSAIIKAYCHDLTEMIDCCFIVKCMAHQVVKGV